MFKPVLGQGALHAIRIMFPTMKWSKSWASVSAIWSKRSKIWCGVRAIPRQRDKSITHPVQSLVNPPFNRKQSSIMCLSINSKINFRQGWAFCDFEKLVFVITSRILTVRMEHIVVENSLVFKLKIFYICSIRILKILEVIAKTFFSKIAKCLTLSLGTTNRCPADYFATNNAVSHDAPSNGATTI